MVLYTDARGECGWGISCGHHWAQGIWTADELPRPINWKEFQAYHMALSNFTHILSNKLVLAKMDNSSSVHYVNHGTGRVRELSDLAKSIRLKEVEM